MHSVSHNIARLEKSQEKNNYKGIKCPEYTKVAIQLPDYLKKLMIACNLFCWLEI